MYYEGYNQLWIFLYTLCGGIVLGFIYDLFRMARRALGAGWALTAFLDVLYTLLGAVVLAITFFTAAQGVLRLYMFLGAALGCLIYLTGMSRLIMGAFNFLHRQLRRLIARFFRTRAGQWLRR